MRKLRQIFKSQTRWCASVFRGLWGRDDSAEKHAKPGSGSRLPLKRGNSKCLVASAVFEQMDWSLFCQSSPPEGRAATPHTHLSDPHLAPSLPNNWSRTSPYTDPDDPGSPPVRRLPLITALVFPRHSPGLLHYGGPLTCALCRGPRGLVIDSSAQSGPADWKDLLPGLSGRVGRQVRAGGDSLDPL